MDEEKEPIDWHLVARQIGEVHKAVFGNGHPEKSLISRMDWTERQVKTVIAVGIAVMTGVLFALIKGVV